MSDFVSFLNTVVSCMTILGLAFMIVLAMPQSRMRDVMKKVLLAIACAIYALSPIDFLPEIALGPVGLVDDLGAVIAGVVCLKQAVATAKGA